MALTEQPCGFLNQADTQTQVFPIGGSKSGFQRERTPNNISLYVILAADNGKKSHLQTGSDRNKTPQNKLIMTTEM